MFNPDQSITLESNECYDIEKKFSKNERLLITASLDCSINLWLIPQGVQLKSIYNFSPVVSLTYCSSVIFAGMRKCFFFNFVQRFVKNNSRLALR